jgi:putative CocE/NonD family hydrolase
MHVCCVSVSGAYAQYILSYKQTLVMIPMRDGTKLYTVIYSPENKNEKFPILLERTPYGAYRPANYIPFANTMGKEGYIFVYQDIRGKYKSEGSMEIHQPLIHLSQPGAVDESTDTFDTIEWLLHNVENNNGRAGIAGISYPGWLALVGSVDPHPALKAASPQGTMGDLFLGDDFHHNGAFRLSYGMEYTYEVEATKNDSDFDFPQYDLYDWYLRLGTLQNVNEKYFHNRIPTWNNFVKHPNYDHFWQQNSPLSYTGSPEVPMLHVGGYYDQEDIMGPQLMYKHLEKKDSFNHNFLCLGPWYHGQWSRTKGDSIANISFESNTSEYFQKLQQQWFAYWLKGTGDGKFAEATCFQTGSNRWKTYGEWPPKAAVVKKLYANANNGCSFKQPAGNAGKISYVSDPAKPVPYRLPPIEATYGYGSRWRPWLVEDQRFVYSRPDVISFTSDTLAEAITVTGAIKAHLTASTTGTDADWIVKLIDVYPDENAVSLKMSGYQFAVAMEVFRGRYRKSLTNPSPLIAGKPEIFEIELHEINHVFKPGHRLMIQIQSSWFPVIDRNPQKYVPNIFLADEKDYIKATQTIFCNGLQSTYLSLPVMDE